MRTYNTSIRCYQCNVSGHGYRECPFARDKKRKLDEATKLSASLTKVNTRWDTNKGRYYIENKDEVIEFFELHKVTYFLNGMIAENLGNILTQDEISAINVIRFSMSNWNFLNFIEEWALCDKVTIAEHTVYWSHLLDKLVRVNKLKYKEEYHKHERRAIQYLSIGGVPVKHERIYGSEFVNHMTGKGPFYKEIRELYMEIFSDDVEDLLKPVISTIGIKYLPKPIPNRV
jgi:hypothetical protein